MAASADSTPSNSDSDIPSTVDVPKEPKQRHSQPPEVSPTSSERGSPGKKSSERGRGQRPKLVGRNSSSIIVPRSQAHIEHEENYGPGDARAMSPRRNSQETEAMEEATRVVVREHARQVQLSLLEIAESIEMVKQDHDKLEKQNVALQDYIGGLTRTLSKGQVKSGKK